LELTVKDLAPIVWVSILAPLATGPLHEATPEPPSVHE
jgi:hypothetical protein